MLLLTVNGIERTLSSDETTLARIVQHLNLEGKRIAVELNGEIVPKSRYSVTHLRNGDKLEVVAAIGGG
ncbi:MAG: sulfur carrier protein ThiS [Betaproteobacteria bacterium]|nr:sulfur carrier protein ThiS [Betaproteobacteria bacterium]MBA3777687.1 sulfur carrier protein ThiS [Betaproteobacteria bacterium]